MAKTILACLEVIRGFDLPDGVSIVVVVDGATAGGVMESIKHCGNILPILFPSDEDLRSNLTISNERNNPLSLSFLSWEGGFVSLSRLWLWFVSSVENDEDDEDASSLSSPSEESVSEKSSISSRLRLKSISLLISCSSPLFLECNTGVLYCRMGDAIIIMYSFSGAVGLESMMFVWYRTENVVLVWSMCCKL